jgi:hypothetical protein
MGRFKRRSRFGIYAYEFPLAFGLDLSFGFCHLALLGMGESGLRGIILYSYYKRGIDSKDEGAYTIL